MRCIIFFLLGGVLFLQATENKDSFLGDKWDLPIIGKLKTRSAREIPGSLWSIGCETLDRDFAIYKNYQAYLGVLGAKAVRLQAGWAKTERERGQYNWEWLDKVVNDALEQGVQPWLQLSYGNPIYPGGGGIGLGGDFPSSPEALIAWDRWVRETVRHYRNRVVAWEIWNEPDINKKNKPEVYTQFYIRTAEIIREEQPQSQIFALGLASNLTFAERFLEEMRKLGKLSLIDAITVHGYPHNPDDLSLPLKMRQLVRKYSEKIEVRQGETGAPSTPNTFGALRDRPWTELTQAKWNLRRMLAHYAEEIPFNLFTLMELAYQKDGKVVMNTKGLLKANPDLTVAYPKPAYFAAQHVFTIFDHAWKRLKTVKFSVTPNPEKLVVSAYQRGEVGGNMLTMWLNNGVPSEKNDLIIVDIQVTGVIFRQPVVVDLLTGNVYLWRQDQILSSEQGVTLKKVPVYDSPILFIERDAIQIKDN